MTAAELTLREHIREAITTRDERLFNQIAAFAGMSALDDVFEAFARAELAASPPEVQEFWNSPCNCCGALN